MKQVNLTKPRAQTRANGVKVPDSKKRAYFPRKLYFDEYGNCSETEPMKYWGWFMRAPLLFDPTGGVFFDAKTNEGTKLTRFGNEGRSTSMTITAFVRGIKHRLRSSMQPRTSPTCLSGRALNLARIVYSPGCRLPPNEPTTSLRSKTPTTPTWFSPTKRPWM